MPKLRVATSCLRHVISMFAVFAVVMNAATAPGQGPGTRPVSTQPVLDPQRAADLIALIEGPNSAQARLTGARELLRLGWPESPARVAAILRGPNVPAKTAVATALSDLRQCLAVEFIDPLIAMLGDPDEAAARAAGAALAAFDHGESIDALRRYVRDAASPPSGRSEAIRALGAMPHRDAAALLAELLDEPDPNQSAAALAALEQATGNRFGGDADAARAWWLANRDVSVDQWQQAQIRRLLEQRRQADASLLALEARLSRTLRELYTLTPDSERPALLAAYVSDVNALVRLLALELVQTEIAEGRALSTDTVAGVRGLLTDGVGDIRAAAVRTIASLRGTGDGEAFVAMLAAERDPSVRVALAGALGYVGGGSAAEPLLALLQAEDARIASVAVASLGRLAERGILDASARAALIQTLLASWPHLPRGATELRERTLWAMSRVPDARLAEVFVAALDPSEHPAVRQSAARGVVALADPRLNGALFHASRDADAAVRQIAVEALGRAPQDDSALTALWERLPASAEPDEGVRTAAWAGALRILQERPIADIERWLERLNGGGDIAPQRLLDLLQLLETRLADAPAEQRARLGRVRARVAAQHVALGDGDAAIAKYLSAVEDLHAAGDAEEVGTIVALLRFALQSDRYDARVVTALATLNPAIDGAAIWEGVRDEIERSLTPETADRAIAMLSAFQQRPPASMPADATVAAEALLRQARELRAARDAETVQTALAQLREDPLNESARSAIANLGVRAAPTVCDALVETLEGQSASAAPERLLYELLSELTPAWSGYSAEAPTSEKLAAVRAARQRITISE